MCLPSVMNVRFWKLSCYRPIFNKTVYRLYSFSSFAKAATNASILIGFAICQFIPAACVILIFPERVGHHTHNGNGCFFGLREIPDGLGAMHPSIFGIWISIRIRLYYSAYYPSAGAVHGDFYEYKNLSEKPAGAVQTAVFGWNQG